MKTPLLARCPMQRADESLDVGARHGIEPALGLDVDQVQPQDVLPDHALHAFIAATAQALNVLSAAAVADRVQNVQHELLEELGRLLEDPVTQLGSEG